MTPLYGSQLFTTNAYNFQIIDNLSMYLSKENDFIQFYDESKNALSFKEAIWKGIKDRKIYFRHDGGYGNGLLFELNWKYGNKLYVCASTDSENLLDCRDIYLSKNGNNQVKEVTDQIFTFILDAFYEKRKEGYRQDELILSRIKYISVAIIFSIILFGAMFSIP